MTVLVLDALAALAGFLISMVANVPGTWTPPGVIPDDQYACVRAWHWPETGDALSLCRPLADGGWAPAQAIVAARLWEAGEDAAALAHAEQAAEAGDRMAQYQLGTRYLKGGDGVPADLERARTLLEAGARQGCDLCFIALAIVADRTGDPAGRYAWLLVAKRHLAIHDGAEDFLEHLTELRASLPTEDRRAAEERAASFVFEFSSASPGSAEVHGAVLERKMERFGAIGPVEGLIASQIRRIMHGGSFAHLVAPSEDPWVERLSYENWPHDVYAAWHRML